MSSLLHRRLNGSYYPIAIARQLAHGVRCRAAFSTMRPIWGTREELEAMSATLPASAPPLLVQTGSTVTHLFSISQVNNCSVVLPWRFLPTSIHGKAFPTIISAALSRAAHEHGFRSPYWVYTSQLRLLNVSLQQLTENKVFPITCGSELVFNVDQLSCVADTATIERVLDLLTRKSDLLQCNLWPRGLDGQPFSALQCDTLFQVFPMGLSPFFTNAELLQWMPCVELHSAAVGCPMPTDGHKVYYDAEQSTAPEVIRAKWSDQIDSVRRHGNWLSRLWSFTSSSVGHGVFLEGASASTGRNSAMAATASDVNPGVPEGLASCGLATRHHLDLTPPLVAPQVHCATLPNTAPDDPPVQHTKKENPHIPNPQVDCTLPQALGPQVALPAPQTVEQRQAPLQVPPTIVELTAVVSSSLPATSTTRCIRGRWLPRAVSMKLRSACVGRSEPTSDTWLSPAEGARCGTAIRPGAVSVDCSSGGGAVGRDQPQPHRLLYSADQFECPELCTPQVFRRRTMERRMASVDPQHPTVPLRLRRQSGSTTGAWGLRLSGATIVALQQQSESSACVVGCQVVGINSALVPADKVSEWLRSSTCSEVELLLAAPPPVDHWGYPYRGHVKQKLQTLAAAMGFTSPVWLSDAVLPRLHLRAKEGAVWLQLAHHTARLYNRSDLEECAAATTTSEPTTTTKPPSAATVEEG